MPTPPSPSSSTLQALYEQIQRNAIPYQKQKIDNFNQQLFFAEHLLVGADQEFSSQSYSGYLPVLHPTIKKIVRAYIKTTKPKPTAIQILRFTLSVLEELDLDITLQQLASVEGLVRDYAQVYEVSETDIATLLDPNQEDSTLFSTPQVQELAYQILDLLDLQ